MKINVFLFFGLPSPLGPHKKTLIHSIDGFLMVVDQIFWKNHKKTFGHAANSGIRNFGIRTLGTPQTLSTPLRRPSIHNFGTRTFGIHEFGTPEKWNVIVICGSSSIKHQTASIEPQTSNIQHTKNHALINS